MAAADQVPFKVAIFHGNLEESFVAFQEDYEMYCELKGWTEDHDKCYFMRAFLRDHARNMYTEVYEDVGDDYTALAHRLADVFLPPAWRNFHKSALADRIQRPHEEVTSYLSSLRFLCRNAYPTMPARYRNEFLQTKFIDGLHSHIRMHLRTTLPGASLDEAITAARNYEAGLKLAHGVRDAGPSGSGQVLAGFISRGQPSSHRSRTTRSVRRSRAGRVSNYSRYQPASSRPHSNNSQWASDGSPICHGCGVAGHMRRNCPGETGSRGRYQSTRNSRTSRPHVRGRGRTARRINAVHAEFAGSAEGEYDNVEECDEFDDDFGESEVEALRKEVELLRLKTHRCEKREAAGYSGARVGCVFLGAQSSNSSGKQDPEKRKPRDLTIDGDIESNPGPQQNRWIKRNPGYSRQGRRICSQQAPPRLEGRMIRRSRRGCRIFSKQAPVRLVGRMIGSSSQLCSWILTQLLIWLKFCSTQLDFCKAGFYRVRHRLVTLLFTFWILWTLPVDAMNKFWKEPSEIYVCPKTFGISYWALPRLTNDLDSGLERLTEVNFTAYATKLKYVRYPAQRFYTNGSLCLCQQKTIHLLKDLFAKRKFARFHTKTIPVSELDCHRMTRWRESPHGKLLWINSAWQTNNTLKWLMPFGVATCCRWLTFSVNNCYLFEVPVYYTNPFYLTSSLVNIPPDCRPSSEGRCRFRDGEFFMWEGPAATQCVEPDSTSQLGYEVISGSTVGSEHYWVAADGNTATYYYADPDHKEHLPNCLKPSVNVSFQFSWAKVGVQSERTTARTISKEKFLALMHKARQRAYVDHKIAINAIRSKPTSFVRSAAGRNNISAYVYDDVLMIRPCLTIPPDQYQVITTIRPELEETGTVPVQFVVHNQLFQGFVGPDRIVEPSSPPGSWLPWDVLTRPYQHLAADHIVYPLQIHNTVNPATWVPQVTNPPSTYFLHEYVQELPTGFTPINTEQAKREVEAYFQSFFPFTGNTPVGAQALWFLVIIIWGTVTLAAFLCIPKLKVWKRLSPMYWVCSGAKVGIKAAKRYSKKRWTSPRFRRRRKHLYREYLDERRSRTLRTTQLLLTERDGTIARVCSNQTARESNMSLSAVLHLKLNQLKKKGLLDTGADVSLVNSNIVAELNSEIQQSNQTAVDVNGRPVTITGATVLKIQLSKRMYFYHTFYIVDTLPYDCILGYDYIQRMGPILIDAENNQLHVYTRRPRAASIVLPLGERKTQPWGEWPIYANEYIEVPERHEEIFFVKCPRLAEKADFIFEPAAKNLAKAGLRGANAAVRVQRGEIPIRVLNAQEIPAKIHRGTHLGTVSTLGKSSSILHLSTTGLVPIKKTTNSYSHLPDVSKSNLTPEQKKELRTLLFEYEDRFAKDETDLGCMVGIEHRIDTGDTPPIRQRPYRTEVSNRPKINKEIQKMLRSGVLRPSISAWGAPAVLVPKKNGDTRFCVDYRRINSATRKDIFPLPLISEVLDSLNAAKYFSNLDLASGYWQIPVAEEDIPKTAVVVYNGLFEFTKMPFGLTNAPATFQRAMEHVLTGLQPDIALIYLDDCVIHSATFEEHLLHLRQIFDRFRAHNLKMKGSKCNLAANSIEFLGHVITPEGLKVDKTKVTAVENYPAPTNTSELRRFLGLAGYYRRFVPNFSLVAKPLFNLLKNCQFKRWDKDSNCEKAFHKLKSALTHAPVLAYPDFRKPFLIESDASGIGLGCVLVQEDENRKAHPIAYASRCLNAAERNYTATELECLAVHYALKTFRPYIYGRPVTVYTDHEALKWLLSLYNPSGRLARWALSLQEFDLQVCYRPGKTNYCADALSRLPLVGAVTLAGQPSDVFSHFHVREAKTLRDYQQEDPEWGALYSFLTNGTLPQDENLQAWVTKQAKKFSLHNDLLVLNQKGRRHNQMRVLLPETLVNTFLYAYHDDKFGGHRGVLKTVDSLRQKYFFPDMDERVAAYVRSCPVCQKNKPATQPAKPPLKPIEPTAPWDMIALDLMELPLSYNGNRYVIVISDYLTRFVEAHALPDQSAISIANVVVREIICRYGTPRKILSDASPTLLSSVMDAVVQLCAAKRLMTTPYRPQTDGLVERWNRTFQDILRPYVDKGQRDWDDHLPFAAFVARTKVQESLKESPYFLLFGQDAVLPIDAAFHFQKSRYVPTEDLSYGDQLRYHLTEAWQAAKNNLTEAQQRQKYQYDKKANNVSFKAGDLVLIQKETRPGRAMKLGPKQDGPYEIKQLVGTTAFLCPPGHPTAVPFSRNVAKLKLFQLRQADNNDQVPGMDPADIQPSVVKSDDRPDPEPPTAEAEGWYSADEGEDEPVQLQEPVQQQKEPIHPDQPETGRYNLRPRRK